MRNVWKGMILGALAGAGIGLAVDGLDAMRIEGKDLGRQALAGARDLATDGAEAVKDAHLGERLKESGLTERAIDVASEGRSAVRDAHLGDRARAVTDRAAKGASERLNDSGVVGAAQERAHQVADRLST